MRNLASGAAGQQLRLARHPLVRRLLEACAETEDGVDGARIVDVVVGDARRVRRAWRLRLEHLPEEAAGTQVEREHPTLPQILVADGGGEILPPGVGRIGRRLQRMQADVAEAARDPDSVGPNEAGIREILLFGVIALRIPSPFGRSIECRIGVNPEADDAGRSPVDLLVDAGGRRFDPLVEPQPEGVRLLGHTKPWLVDQPGVGEATRTFP